MRRVMTCNKCKHEWEVKYWKWLSFMHIHTWRYCKCPNAIKEVGINQLGFNELMMECLNKERYAVIQ